MMKFPTHFISVFTALATLLFPVVLPPTSSAQQPVTIAISKTSPNYEHFLSRSDSTICVVDMYSLTIDSALLQLKGCDALLVTGGEDVYPGWYGKEKEIGRCTETNLHRDSLDMALISLALQLKMPVFGICRGHQIINVFLGGTLVIDIPTDVPAPIIHQCEDYLHCFHPVFLPSNSLLSKISDCDSASVTTNHHQAVDQIAPVLSVNALSKDKVVEGAEWKNPADKSYLMGVQWHPERMEKTNPLSGMLADEFINQAKKYAANKHEDGL